LHPAEYALGGAVIPFETNAPHHCGVAAVVLIKVNYSLTAFTT